MKGFFSKKAALAAAAFIAAAGIISAVYFMQKKEEAAQPPRIDLQVEEMLAGFKKQRDGMLTKARSEAESRIDSQFEQEAARHEEEAAQGPKPILPALPGFEDTSKKP